MIYMVIAKVDGTDYLTKVEANTLLGAEHAILDEGICTRFGYGVDGAQAFGPAEMKTECFAGRALSAEPIQGEALTEIIRNHNSELKRKVEAYDKAEATQKKMEALEKELQALRETYEAELETYKSFKCQTSRAGRPIPGRR